MSIIDKISIEQWFIALVAAVIGAVVGGIYGHVFTLKLYRERANSIENGLFHEVELIKEYFESWLAVLLDEYRKPVRETFSGTEGYDTGCLESLVVESIAAGRILSKDRRKLILNLKKTLSGVAKEDQLRNEHTKFYEAKDAFMVPTPSTARLIGSAVEIIYYTKKFIQEKDEFTFSDSTAGQPKAEIAFESAGIDFNHVEWSRISEHHLQSA